MAIVFNTSAPQKLLNSFNARIDQSENVGKIETWVRSDDKVYYTHKATEWNKKAWLKPIISSEKLTFNIIKPNNANITSIVYAYYHGHLIETFLNHFDAEFSWANASAMPASGDVCR